MKERLVKGSNLRDVVRMLRTYERKQPLPDLGDWERDLMGRRVAPTTWYALKVFDSLMQAAHRYVFDGSEAAAQRMGRAFAIRMIEDEHPQTIVVPDDPQATLANIAALWRQHFNFGELTTRPLGEGEDGPGARLRLTGYPDMSACHGHALIGCCLEALERAGVQDVQPRIEERPWMHNSVLTYTLHWK